MKPEEILGNFLEYNTPVLNEIQKESKEVSAAFSTVVNELFEKFILPTKELKSTENEKVVPKPLFNIFDLVVWKDGKGKFARLKVGGVTKIRWSATKSDYIYTLIIQDPKYFLETESIPQIPKSISNAINKYSAELCANLFIQRGESGTKTIAEGNTFTEGGVKKQFTTRQAQAAINAGEWLFIYASLVFRLENANPLVYVMNNRTDTRIREQKLFWGQASTPYNVLEEDIVELYRENLHTFESLKETPKETTKWSEMSTQELKEELDANLEIIDIFDEDDPEAITEIGRAHV